MLGKEHCISAFFHSGIIYLNDSLDGSNKLMESVYSLLTSECDKLTVIFEYNKIQTSNLFLSNRCLDLSLSAIYQKAIDCRNEDIKLDAKAKIHTYFEQAIRTANEDYYAFTNYLHLEAKVSLLNQDHNTPLLMYNTAIKLFEGGLGAVL